MFWGVKFFFLALAPKSLPVHVRETRRCHRACDESTDSPSTGCRYQLPLKEVVSETRNCLVTCTNINSTMEMESSTLRLARAWVALDPNPVTAAFVQRLISDADTSANNTSANHNDNNINGTTTMTVAKEQADSSNGDTSTTHHSRSVSTTKEQQQQNQKLLQTWFPANDRIAFGTAGLRAAMRPGPMSMNDLVVIQTAQGIARYCQQTFLQGGDKHNNEPKHETPAHNNNSKRPKTHQIAAKLAVVIGYDHRASAEYQLSSLNFALLTALVFRQTNFDRVVLLDGYVATPMIPFAVLRQAPILFQTHNNTNNSHNMTTTSSSIAADDCHCIGIMITASHNPKQDAGYKVYWNDGCQIRSPTDQGIAASILHNLTPWMDYGAALEGHRTSSKDQQQNENDDHDPCCGLSQKETTQEIIDAYYNALLSSGLCTDQASQWTNPNVDFRPPSFCYSAMHGVGYPFAKRAFSTFGLPPFVSVPSQQEPDPDFPSVAFPNPEEKGALDLAKEFAAENDEGVQCDIVLANDPDADRLAVAEKDRMSGEWTVFTGDQIGAMLGHWMWQQTLSSQSKQSAPSVAFVPSVCASTVSSKLLAEIARVEGFHWEETLTGFKWIGSRAAELHHSPVPPGEKYNLNEQSNDETGMERRYKTIFCYEEAIGFCCGNVIFDKDGISALAVFAELCYSVYNRGLNMGQHLQSLYDRYGEFVSHNGYYFVADPSVVSTLMNCITHHGACDTLQAVGPYPVESIRYLGVPGYDSTRPDKIPVLLCSASSPMLTLRFVNGCVAQFRGSGTEPKFKYYMELQGKPGISRETLTSELQEMAAIILGRLLEPEKNGLRAASQ